MRWQNKEGTSYWEFTVWSLMLTFDLDLDVSEMNCYNKSGENYRGQVNRTRSGRLCNNWLHNNRFQSSKFKELGEYTLYNGVLFLPWNFHLSKLCSMLNSSCHHLTDITIQYFIFSTSSKCLENLKLKFVLLWSYYLFFCNFNFINFKWFNKICLLSKIVNVDTDKQ